MAKKYTRKQLKKPDEFISLSMKVWDLVQRHAKQVIVMLGVAVVVIGGVWIWSYFANARAAKATGVLVRAFDIYNQTVIPMASKLPDAKEDDIPRFKTRAAKLEAADKEFSKVMEASGGSLNSMALLMRAGVRYDQGRYDDAIKDYQQFLAESDDQRFNYRAQEGVAYCYEARKSLDQALEHFRKLPRDGQHKWVAIYHEARILAKKGQKDQAAKLLRQVVDKSKDKTLVNRASDHLANLGG